MSIDLYGDWEKLLKAAQKKKASVFNKEKNLSDAAKLFHHVGGVLDDLGKPLEAADAYSEEADCHLRLGDPYEAGTSYQLAAEAIREADVPKCVEYLRLAARQYEAYGNFKKAGRMHKDAGDILLKAPKTEKNTRDAIEDYERAISIFQLEGSAASSIIDCYAYCSSLRIRLLEFEEAAEAYEAAAETAERARFTAVRTREFFLRAFFCFLMGDIAGKTAGEFLRRVRERSAAFGRSVEKEFAENYLKAFNKVDYLGILDVVDEYKGRLNLNPWFDVAFKRLDGEVQKRIAMGDVGDMGAEENDGVNDDAVREVCGGGDDDDGVDIFMKKRMELAQSKKESDDIIDPKTKAKSSGSGSGNCDNGDPDMKAIKEICEGIDGDDDGGDGIDDIDVDDLLKFSSSSSSSSSAKPQNQPEVQPPQLDNGGANPFDDNEDDEDYIDEDGLC